MIDKNGEQISLGAKVRFDKWDEKTDPKNPKRIPCKGIVTALAGGSLENSTLGQVTIKSDKEEVTVEAQAVEVADE